MTASFEIYSQLQTCAFDMYRGKYDPLTAWENILKPVSNKAIGNAKRLSKQTKK